MKNNSHLSLEKNDNSKTVVMNENDLEFDFALCHGCCSCCRC